MIVISSFFDGMSLIRKNATLSNIASIDTFKARTIKILTRTSTDFFRQKFIQYIRMLCPGRFILVESVSSFLSFLQDSLLKT